MIKVNDYYRGFIVEIKQMQYFIEVARFKSMTKASEHLYITQPTISNAIKLLEEELKVELIDRSKRQIVLTDAGKVFQKICKDFLKMYDNIPVELNHLLEIEEGHVRIGIPTIMNVNRFTRLISEFHNLYPNVTFHILEDGSKRIENEILKDDLDIGITVLPTNNELFNSFFFFSEELKVVVNKNHYLANASSINLRDLSSESFILFNSDYYLNDRIKECCKMSGFNPNIISESTQWTFIEQMILSELGICILPSSITDLLNEDLKSVSINNLDIGWELAIIWKKEGYQNNITKKLLEFLQDRMLLNE